MVWLSSINGFAAGGDDSSSLPFLYLCIISPFLRPNSHHSRDGSWTGLEEGVLHTTDDCLAPERHVGQRIPHCHQYLDDQEEEDQKDVLTGQCHGENDDEHDDVKDGRVAPSLVEHLLALALGPDEEAC